MKKYKLLNIGKNFWIQLLDVEKIILKKTEFSREQFFLLDEIILSEEKVLELKDIFRKVSFGYPLEYVLESAEFYWLDFFVDKRCLIPRDDTEVMVDEAIKEIMKVGDAYMHTIYIDVWTGSWAIPISIVDNIWDKIDKAFAVDISEEALEVARKNIKKYNFIDTIELVHSDLLENITNNIENQNNIIITANLPYIKNEDYWNMDKEVILHEPSVALYGWKKTGFELYEKLIEQILTVQKKNTKQIVLFIEIWFDQKDVAITYIDNQHLKYKIYKDNWWVERCMKIIF